MDRDVVGLPEFTADGTNIRNPAVPDLTSTR